MAADCLPKLAKMPAEIGIPGPAPTARSPRSVIFGTTAHKALRSGAIWGYVFGIAIASSSLSYTKLYRTEVQRDALAAAYGTNRATAAIFGPAPLLQTVSGFTIFKIGMTLTILGAIWGLLTSTRLLRGEEEEGRWELLLTGQTSRRRAVLQAAIGLAAGAVTLWAVTAAIAICTGLDSEVSITVGAATYLALALVTPAVMFLGIGVLTSQFAATRRQAAAYASVFLGISYALRMLADAGVGLHGLIWVSPLGWVEELRPLTDPQPIALLPIAGLTGVVLLAAVLLADRRDVGASILGDRTPLRSHLRLLNSPMGLAIRLTRGTVIAWWVAIALSGFLYGLIAKSAGSTISGSSVHTVFTRLGSTGTGAEAVLGICFLVIAVLVAFLGAGQLAAARTEESTGRIDSVLALPVSRAQWLAGRLLVVVACLVASGLIAGLFAWMGAASQHSGIGAGVLLGAGINLVPPAIVILGIGVLAFGVAPRSASAVVYGYLGWSLLVLIVGGVGTADHWILDTSVFHQMASAPAVPPRWAANGIMVLIGTMAALVGGLAFRHRDLKGA